MLETDRLRGPRDQQPGAGLVPIEETEVAVADGRFGSFEIFKLGAVEGVLDLEFGLPFYGLLVQVPFLVVVLFWVRRAGDRSSLPCFGRDRGADVAVGGRRTAGT
jgi:hypothetical protein